MSEASTELERQDQALEFMKDFFGMEMPEPALDPEFKAHTTLTYRNQPEFYADAPWRVEPDQDRIPLLFVIREANLQDEGMGPWRLDELRLEQWIDGSWRQLQSFGPDQLPHVDAQGFFERGFWSHNTHLDLRDLQGIDLQARDEMVSLRVVFDGRFPPHDKPDPKPPHRYLQVFLARHPLPQGRAAQNGGHRTWFYGDTHYHSSHTNDVWEFGNPVGDARRAGQAVGLDWLVITDHSCDLDEPDLMGSGMTRWERLKKDLGDPAISNDRFRILLGEEVTLLNAKGGYIHMLAMGTLDDLIPGGFWSEEDTFIKQAAGLINELAHLHGGYPPDAVERLFGEVLDLDQVLARLPQNALVFAAHPYDPAQPPFINSTWVKKELRDGRLTGHEFWNGRSRRQTNILSDPTDNPFEESEWDDPKKLKKSDKARLKQLRRRVEKDWEPVLRKSVDAWADGAELPSPRPVFVAGSDAHGDFNYSVGVGWDYRQHRWITDNALGRVRTAVHFPANGSTAVPTQAEILAALRAGACAVTDGPLLEFSAQQDGQVAHMGQVLPLAGDGEAEVQIVAHSTPEFGPIEEVEVVVYLKGQPWRRPTKKTVRAGEEQVLELDGLRGYCRVQAWTTGLEGERFCCFTNPIWLRIADGEKKRLRLRVREGTG